MLLSMFMETYKYAKGRFIAVEGLDGSGKTTITNILVERTNSACYSWKNGKLAQYRDRFDNAPCFPRFAYFLMVGAETGFRADKMREDGDVYVDRTIISTIAYHKALGVPSMWMSLIPRRLIDQINIFLYFTAPVEVRTKRMLDRVRLEGKQLNSNDRSSIVLSEVIDREYRLVLPSRTLVVENNDKQINDRVDVLMEKLYAK